VGGNVGRKRRIGEGVQEAETGKGVSAEAREGDKGGGGSSSLSSKKRRPPPLALSLTGADQ
jgi:hypothetical protein